MNEIIKTYINSVKQLCPNLTDEALTYFAEELSISELPVKHFYIQANTVQRQLGYVYSGLLRAFYIDDKGNEKVVNFTREGNYASHYTNFGTNRPSKFYFQCIEPSVMINISHDHIRVCCEKFPSFERYMRLMVEDAHRDLLNRIEGFIFGNAESRYLDFIKDNPDLFHRIPLSYLCSYLGVERQSLTRIRQKLVRR